MKKNIVELKNITKVFPGVTALDHMSIELKRGEIHGLIGENGAGKSTLIKILTGVHIPDEGNIFINDEEVIFHNPNDSRVKGIACVYQELNILSDANIVDNIFIGNYKSRKFFLDSEYMNKRTVEIMNSLGHQVEPNMCCGTLGMGMQQMVEIAKAIQMEANVIILDEPTSSLGEKEIENLFHSIRELKKQGVTFLFVSHKLEEIFDLCDRVTIMRDAKHIITTKSENLTRDALISYMVGRNLDMMYPKIKTHREKVALEIKNMTRLGEYNNINFKAYGGEILGFSGLVGAGRTELFEGIFGLRKNDEGEVYINGNKLKKCSPKNAIENRLAFITEDRKNQGLILDFSVRDNIGVIILDKLKKILFLDNKKWRDISRNFIERLKIKVSDDTQIAGQLSGGNQQKLVIGKWLASNADVFVFDEPTKGIDVGAKIEVYKIMNELISNGKCVIMISSELPEILGMSDRVIVMRDGNKMTEIDRNSEHFNQEDIMKVAWGDNLDE